jgi:hypothetical protein
MFIVPLAAMPHVIVAAEQELARLMAGMLLNTTYEPPGTGSSRPPALEKRRRARIAPAFYSFVRYRREFANFATLLGVVIGRPSFGWHNTTRGGPID